ncbi:alpha/beta fold hydrolase [Cyanobium sp. NIES-981]|uniref:alpha/beta fold hydrolase n=1 Tax=Cyanobium sp. NIES-981 TaxID=1851505 RepID=UPI0007DD8F6A|nr:alpha/beta fold hydrolase [Cyanobium sp. NIES-981]SBO44370.1 Alpha/beta hydrolase superfamily protein [Cyanobium sp. NIES-981]
MLSTPPHGRGPTPDSGVDWGEHSTWIWQGLAVHWRHLPPAAAGPGCRSGERGSVVLLHGFGAASGHWRRNAAALAAAGWRVYALDLIGFGASDQPGPHRRRRLDNRLWARQVQAFVAEVVGHPAVLVGHSLGGLVALTCASLFPGWVDAVVAAPLPDPALLLGPGAWPPRRRPWRRRLRRWGVIVLCRLLPLELLVPLLAHSPLLALGIQSAYTTPVIGDRELHRLIAQPARRPGAVRSLRAMSIAMALRPHGATAPTLLRRLQRPLLLIWGHGDQLVPIQVAEQIRRLRPDLALVDLEHCGHCPHDEASEPFNATLLDWLAAAPTASGRGRAVIWAQQPGPIPKP